MWDYAKPWYLLRYIAQASARQNTDLPTIRNMLLPTIDTDTQAEIAKHIQQSFELCRQFEQLLDAAIEWLKDAE